MLNQHIVEFLLSVVSVTYNLEYVTDLNIYACMDKSVAIVSVRKRITIKRTGILIDKNES